MRTKTVLVVAAITALLASAVVAESPKVTLDAQNMKIEQAATEMSQQAGVQIVCDTGLRGIVNGNFSMELEKMLDVITKSGGMKWQKLYLPAQGEQKPTIAQIKTQADALAALSDAPLVVYDPATGKQSVYLRQTVDAPTISPEKLGLKPLYFISSAVKKEETKAAGDDALSQYMKLGDDRQKMLNEMSPEQRQTAYQQELMAQMQMDPQSRAQMMKDQFTARHSMPEEMRDQYRNMMRDTFRTLREQGAIPDWGGHGGDHGPRGDHGGNRGGQQ